MTTIAVGMVRDEADIIGAVIDRLRPEVDAIIVADNGSTDETRAVLEARDVELVDDPVRGYYQAQKMSELAAKAADAGADWVVPFDADEVWYSPHGRLADFLALIPQTIVVAPWLEHVCTPADGDSGDPIVDRPYRRPLPHTLPKVAARARAPVSLVQGNHDAFYPTPKVTGLEVRHFPYRSPEQLERKVRNGVQAADEAGHPETVLSHWRGLLAEIEAVGAERVFRRRVFVSKIDDVLLDPCPR